MLKKIDLKHLLKIFILTIFIVVLIAIYLYSESKTIIKENGLEPYSLWYNLLNGHYGQYMIILSPILIAMAISYNFFKRIHSGIYKYIIMREDYSKYLIKEILWMYVKSLLLFPLLFLVLFFVLWLLFKNCSITGHYSATIYNFPDLLNISNFQYILIESLSVYFFSLVVVNISIILIPFIKKFYLLIILIFIIINFYNFAIANIIDTVLETNCFNIYNGYMINGDTYMDAAFLHMGLLIVFTGFIIYFIYKNKERITKNNG